MYLLTLLKNKLHTTKVEVFLSKITSLSDFHQILLRFHLLKTEVSILDSETDFLKKHAEMTNSLDGSSEEEVDSELEGRMFLGGEKDKLVRLDETLRATQLQPA